jgi:hypothetical protein
MSDLNRLPIVGELVDLARSRRKTPFCHGAVCGD